MKDSPTPPPAPDPTATAGAQTASNIQTAIANARLNRVDQSTPWGSINYTQGPTDANGVPSYSSQIQLSPAQQQLLQQQEGMSTSRNTIAQHLLEQAGSSLGQPLDLSHIHGLYDRYAPQGAAGAGGMPMRPPAPSGPMSGLGNKAAALQPPSPNPNPAARATGMMPASAGMAPAASGAVANQNPLMPGGGSGGGQNISAIAQQLAQLLSQAKVGA